MSAPRSCSAIGKRTSSSFWKWLRASAIAASRWRRASPASRLVATLASSPFDLLVLGAHRSDRAAAGHHPIERGEERVVLEVGVGENRGLEERGGGLQRGQIGPGQTPSMAFISM